MKNRKIVPNIPRSSKKNSTLVLPKMENIRLILLQIQEKKC